MKFDLQANFDWLQETEVDLAKLKAAVHTWEKGEKIEKARLMRLSPDVSQTAKESYAYAHPDYSEYIKKLSHMIEQYETLKLQRETRFALFEAWRSLEASGRQTIRATR